MAPRNTQEQDQDQKAAEAAKRQETETTAPEGGEGGEQQGVKDDEIRGVATDSENAKLEHSAEGAPMTTRDDALDVGVPMLPGSPSEPQGPEDALGVGPKRGDYRDRLGGVNSTQTRLNEKGEVEVVAQNPRAEDIGDAEGLKGGVETDPAVSRVAGGAPLGRRF